MSATETTSKPRQRFERLVRPSYPRMISVKIEDLGRGEILSLSPPFGNQERYEKIQEIREKDNVVFTGTVGLERKHFKQEKEWQILDVPRVGSIWDMMHGKLRIAAVHGTEPDEIEIFYEDLFYRAAYNERPPITFRLWSDLRLTGLLLAVD